MAAKSLFFLFVFFGVGVEGVGEFGFGFGCGRFGFGEVGRGVGVDFGEDVVGEFALAVGVKENGGLVDAFGGDVEDVGVVAFFGVGGDDFLEVSEDFFAHAAFLFFEGGLGGLAEGADAAFEVLEFGEFAFGALFAF